MYVGSGLWSLRHNYFVLGGIDMNSESKKPNILFFFTDQQRWDTAGCYGNTMNLTPALDKMASEGVRFENAFTCQPVCGPARACLQTGTYATENGVFKNYIQLKKSDRTIAQILNDTDYDTAYIGKWHLARTRTEPVPEELRAGYRYWLAADALEHTSHPFEGKLYDNDNKPVEFKKYRVDALTDYAIDYIENRESEKPFYLCISYLEPHHQNDMNTYVAPEGYAERYKNHAIPGDLEGMEIGDWKENLRDYYGICKRIDENFERVLKKLEELGIRENTIVIYSTDHGSHFRTRNEEYKRSCHEASIRIPLVIEGPGFKGGRVADEIASLIDIPPTILKAAGAEIPENMKGKPLQQLAEGNSEGWPQEAFIQISESQVARAIRTKDWKYSIVAPDKDGVKDKDSMEYVEECLYDLKEDPHERNNLVGRPEYRAVSDELKEILIRRMVQAGEAAPVIR